MIPHRLSGKVVVQVSICTYLQIPPLQVKWDMITACHARTLDSCMSQQQKPQTFSALHGLQGGHCQKDKQYEEMFPETDQMSIVEATTQGIGL